MNNTLKIIKSFVAILASHELKVKFWNWLVAPSMQKEKEEALLHLWDTQQFKADKSTYESLRKFKDSIHANKPHRSLSIRRQMMRIAAILLLPLLGMATAYYYLNTRTAAIEILECIAPEGETKEVILPDGSGVTLNSGTVLVYPSEFTAATRTVYLSGEGYFNVTKKSHHPFVVKTQHLNVQVLGTSFNLQAYPLNSKTTTTLLTGSVKVEKTTNPGQSVTLTPNQQLNYDNYTGEFNTKDIDATLYCEWTKGRLNFITVPLKEIFRTLERTYAVTFQVSSGLLQSDLYTTDLYTIKFDQRDEITNVMNIVTKTVGSITYKQKDKQTIVVYPIKKERR
ncbi:FecR family protein [uncultured Bacteroides sp.]|uniref:FecR family protein n=1 Tax=uncultured Bacteroides sp. TaxID=162156 RepID=UPI0025DCD114|nr:FecR family protein [uncultured Bacteroides sp.]